MKKTLKILFIFLFVLIFPLIVFAHPGRTDSNGGHYDRSTGEYHYHDGSSAGRSQSSSSSSTTYNTYTNTNSVDRLEAIFDKYPKTTNSTSTNTSSSYNSTNENNTNWFKENLEVIIFFLIIFGIHILSTIIDFINETIDKIKTKKKTKDSSSASTPQITTPPTDDNTIQTTSTTLSKQYICPKCGSNLIIKTGKYGKFIGCSNYPYCKYTKSIDKNK